MAKGLLERKCLYYMEDGFVTNFGVLFLRSQFMGGLYGGGGPCNAISVFNGLETLKHIYKSGHIGLDRIQETFSNISESLTTYIRNNGDRNYSEPAVGHVYHYATCIRVQWAWIAFPSSLAALTVLFFVWVASSKTLRQFPAWKASPLPWLMYGHIISKISHTGGDGLHENSQNIDEMEKISKEMSMTWVFSPNPHIQV